MTSTIPLTSTTSPSMDIIEVNACHSDIDAIEGEVVEVSGIVDIIHDESFDVVVSAYTTIKEV